MGCNCGKRKMQVTSANISDTAGAEVEGARARALRELQDRVNTARTEAIAVVSAHDGNIMGN